MFQLNRILRSFAVGQKPGRREPSALETVADLNGPRRRPDFIGIGAEKAGTTWLWRMLMDHPDVGVPAVKELRQFGVTRMASTRKFEALAGLLNNHETSDLLFC